MTFSPSSAAKRVAFEQGWPDGFAREYVMERCFNGLSHVQALETCMDSAYVSDVDKQKVRDVLEGKVL